jgi:hypothetical protein
MGKNILFKGDVDINSVVAFKVRSDGTVVKLRHCGDKSIRDKKHMELNKALDVKQKGKNRFSVSIICIGAHNQAFYRAVVFIAAKRTGTEEILRSQCFTVIGARDEARIRRAADDHYARHGSSIADNSATLTASPTHTTSPALLTNQNFQNADQRANPPPPTPDSNELFALDQDPADQRNLDDNSVEIDIQHYPVLKDPYADFMTSRFDN